MDRAQELELEILGRQKFMNAAMKDGNSTIQQFYADATIFVTGGGGFMGKHLIEKLLRACKIKKMYLLMRPKKGKNVQERLDFMLKDPVYDLLRQMQPDFANVLEVVEGDIADLSLGLSDNNFKRITKEVDHIIHLAATIRFDAPLRNATILNVRGTRECVKLAKACIKLKCFTHVSTAFTHATRSRIETEIKEEFYPCPIKPDRIIELAEDTTSVELDTACSEIIKDWPNTYTFTKAIAEELVRTSTKDLPVCVVRPPQISSAYYEPTPGWSDLSVLFGPVGLFVGIGLGVIHVLPVEINRKINMLPVDYVNNTVISAIWDTCERRKEGVLEDPPIYSISSTKRHFTWDLMGAVTRSDDSRRLSSPFTIWYAYLFEVTNPLLHWILTWLLHYIPAYAADGVCKILGIKIEGVPSFIKIYTKIYDSHPLFSYFINNEWYFSDDNVTDMIGRMSRKDRDIFNCDTYTIDYAQLVQAILIGLRKYIVKDGLKDSKKSYRKHNRLYYANIVLMSLYAYAIYYILYFFYSCIKYIIL